MTTTVWNDPPSGMVIQPPSVSQELSRVVIVGPCGAGKTTMATEFAHVLQAAHLALDDLVWGAGWRRRSNSEFIAAIERETSATKWVVDGDYGEVIAREVWPKADLIIWLDYPPLVFIARLIVRELRNGLAHVEPWAGHLAHLRWLVGKVYRSLWQGRSLRNSLPGRLSRLAPEVPLLRLTSPAQARRYLREVAQVRGANADDSSGALANSARFMESW
ncbi:MAG: hypothetical protein H0X65_14165 [Gemmatimonadetes bacterium]|nr:hypothetical protein [Gemmatimonadota bacterium]